MDMDAIIQSDVKPLDDQVSPLIDQEDPLADSMKDDSAFIGKGDKKITVNDIKRKIEELSRTINLSDITKPDCENTTIHTRGICTAYIVFVLISLIGLIGIFIWKYFRGTIKGDGDKNKEQPSTNSA
jgi:hypothetical protein